MGAARDGVGLESGGRKEFNEKPSVLDVLCVESDNEESRKTEKHTLNLTISMCLIAHTWTSQQRAEWRPSSSRTQSAIPANAANITSAHAQILASDFSFTGNSKAQGSS